MNTDNQNFSKAKLTFFVARLSIFAMVLPCTAFGVYSRCISEQDWHRLCELPEHPSQVCRLSTLSEIMCKDSIPCRLGANCVGAVPQGYYFVFPADGKSYKCRC